ncbi:MAG: hypothetical protein Q8940_21725, partial [Bacteroidota bacterium]|nr:hypothetical protein [Bacteroidota bacterium]
QLIPSSINLEGNSLRKVSSETPISNSITDILAVGDTVWLGTSRGLSRSTDRGLSWTNYFGSPDFGQEDISSLAYYKGVIWAATAHSVEKSGQELSEGSGFRYSTDNGKTWKSITQPLDQLNDTVVVYGINRIRALPVTVAVNNLAYDIAIANNTIWIASYAGGLRKSTDMGKTWQRVVLPPDYLNSIKPTDTLKFSLQPVSGSFGPENNLNHRVFSVVATDDSTIYVGTAGGINKSTDGGISWRKFNHLNQANPISGNFVVALGYNAQNKTIWAATWKAEEQSEFYAVSYSSDGGETWHTALNGEKAHNFGFVNNDAIALTDNGAFRTNNVGVDWLLPSSIIDKDTKVPLPAGAFYAATSQANANHGNDIWLGADKGLARLTETNGMWLGDWKVFIASQPLESVNDAFAYPNPFSPDVESVNIKYSTGGIRANVTIRIFDFGMNLVRTVIQNAERGNPIHSLETGNAEKNGVVDFWDGRDDKGNVVPNGVYFYRIDVGSNSPVYGKIMVLM